MNINACCSVLKDHRLESKRSNQDSGLAVRYFHTHCEMTTP